MYWRTKALQTPEEASLRKTKSRTFTEKRGAMHKEFLSKSKTTNTVLKTSAEGKGNDKICPRTGREDTEGEYISTFSLTSALSFGGWLTSRLGRFTPKTGTWYPLYKWLSGPQGRPWWVREILPITGIRSPDRPTRSESLYRLSYPGPLRI